MLLFCQCFEKKGCNFWLQSNKAKVIHNLGCFGVPENEPLLKNYSFLMCTIQITTLVKQVGLFVWPTEAGFQNQDEEIDLKLYFNYNSNFNLHILL